MDGSFERRHRTYIQARSFPIPDGFLGPRVGNPSDHCNLEYKCCPENCPSSLHERNYGIPDSSSPGLVDSARENQDVGTEFDAEGSIPVPEGSSSRSGDGFEPVRGGCHDGNFESLAAGRMQEGASPPG